MRWWSSALFLMGLAGVSRAQTPAGFTPSVDTHLDVMFNSTVVSPAGVTLAKAITQNQPMIGLAGINSSGTFIFVMIDLDVPSRTVNGTRQTLLHCMNTGFKATARRTTNSTVLLTSSDTGPAPYIGPSPPAETPPHGHRYVQLLFQQPTNFAVPAAQSAAVSSRLGFDLQSFMTAAGLGMPVAANFFVVFGSQSQAASSSASASAGTAKNSLLPFEGAAAGGNGMLGSGWATMVAGVLGLVALYVESWYLKRVGC